MLKRKHSIHQDKTITIIDSSEEEEENVLVTCAAETDVSDHTSVSFFKPRCIPENRLFKKSKLSHNAILNRPFCIPLNSFMFGQFTATPPSSLKVSSSGLSLEIFSSLFQLTWVQLTLIEISQNLSEPCLFITVLKHHLRSLHLQLSLTPGEYPCYNPAGSDDQKYIIFYVNKVWYLKNWNGLKRKLLEFSRSQVSVREISAKESNRRQCSAAEASMFGDTDSIPKRTTQKRLSTYSKSQPFVMKNEETEYLRTVLAVYPPPPSPGGIVITNKDAKCLNSGEFLNDVIIDFYLQYVVNEIFSEANRQRCHVFSSFFYQRFSQPLSDDAKEFSLSASERRYARVRKWSGSVDIFSKDYIFIPINESSHWYLAVICFPGKVRKALDQNICDKENCAGVQDSRSPKISNNKSGACILILDSMWRTERDDISQYFRQYLNEEWKSRKTDQIRPRIFNRNSMKCIRPRVPQQDNHYDCGLFLLHYVEKIFEIPCHHFSSSNFQSLESWFNPREVKMKRPMIKRLISTLRRKQSTDS